MSSQQGRVGLNSGFSFVELLVTVVIAGVAFAAMVPLFVQAQEANSADTARNVALQLAQDRIEKIRQLDYDQIELDNLNSTSYAGGQFGPYWDFVRNGNTKRYNITYTVELVPETADPGEEKYKRVEVSVVWDAPPSPVKPAVVQTIVYRQYAGPKIIDFAVEWPGKADAQDALIDAGPVTVDVWINPADIAGMNASAADPADRGWVKFFVSALDGVTVAQGEVNEEYNGEAGRYRFEWDNSATPDGQYTIQFIAYSALEMPGPKLSLPYEVAVTVPPAPTDVTATPYDSRVYVEWGVPGIGDLSHYQLWRGTASGAETLYVDNITANHHDDTGLTNGTTYYYQVKVVDTEGNVSAASAEVSATPDVQTDVTPPTVPAGLTAVKLSGAPTINLTWTASTDDSGIPPWYVIERSSSAAGPWTQLTGMHGTTTYPDSSAGWSSTWYYRVAATDGPNTSAFTAAVGPVTTDPQPTYTLTVDNRKTSDIYVWVQEAGGTGRWFTTAGTPSTVKPGGQRVRKSKSELWNNLPAGLYLVFASTSLTGSPAVPVSGGSSDLSGGSNLVYFQ